MASRLSSADANVPHARSQRAGAIVVRPLAPDVARVSIAPTLDDTAFPTSSASGSGLVSWYAEGFADAFGERLLLFDNAGPALELLRFRGELTSQRGFEMAVRRRAEQLTEFKHPLFAKVRSVTTLDDPHPQLVLVSELVKGERLTTLLESASRVSLRPDPGSAVWLLRQLLPAIAALHAAAAGLPHGVLGTSRIVVTPEGRLAITEHPLGGSIEGLGMTAPDVWRRLGVAARERGGRATLDPGTDVTQIALVALAVLLGRPLRADEYPVRSATIDAALNAWRSSLALRPWFVRALQQGAGFSSAWEALAALDGCVGRINGAWTSRLVPDPATAEASSGKGLARMSTATRALTPYAELEAAPPLALPGDAVITRRLWKINGVLTIIAVAEALCLVALLSRYTALDQLPVPIPLFTKSGPTSASPRLPTIHELTAELDSKPAATTHTATRAAPINNGAAANALGWIQVASPVEVRVYANGRLIGSGANAKFRLPAGRHTIALINDEQGVRTVRPIKLAPGATVVMVAEP
jgi:hypothetical protein